MRGIRSVDENVITGFQRLAEAHPEKTALFFLGERFSYGRLYELTLRFATALDALGVRRGDKVMVYLGNCPQWVIAYFAIQKLGAVVVPTSPIYTPHEVRYQLNDSAIETVVCQDTNIGYVHQMLPETSLKRIIVTNLIDLLPAWKRGVGWMSDRIPHGTIVRHEAVHSFRRLLRTHGAAPPQVEIDPRSDLAYILYTGGTTGQPKGVPGTHSGMVSFVKDMYDVTEGHVSEGNEVFVLVNPLYHIMAQMMFLGVALTVGNPTVLMPMAVVDAVLESIRRYRATIFLGAPALFRMILENDRLAGYDLTSLKFCWSGGDVLPEKVFERFSALTGHPIYQVYGSTETGGVSLSPMDKPPTARSLGRPFPSRRVRVADPATLTPVEPGEVGELLVTSPYLQDYWKKPEETREAFVQIDGQKWYRMGDFVSMDAQGELFYMDRRADVIKHKGFRVSCSEIEAILQDHPAVLEACVVGVPDERVGERIKAIVVTKSDVRGVGSSELIQWCRDRLAAYKVPQYIELRDMLPKSKVGKLLRREVREDERRRAQKAGGADVAAAS